LVVFTYIVLDKDLINVGHGSVLVAPPLLSLESGLAVLVHLELGNDEAGSGDTDGNGGAVGLLTGDIGDVDDKLFTVTGCDLALAGLVHAACDENLVILADGHGADTVTGLKLLGEVGRHELPPGLRVGREVSLARLASAGRNGGGILHVLSIQLIPKDKLTANGMEGREKNGNANSEPQLLGCMAW
jgi:hypothetical protein